MAVKWTPSQVKVEKTEHMHRGGCDLPKKPVTARGKRRAERKGK